MSLASTLLQRGEQTCDLYTTSKYTVMLTDQNVVTTQNHIAARMLSTMVSTAPTVIPSGPVLIAGIGDDGSPASLSKSAMRDLRDIIPSHMIERKNNRRSGPSQAKQSFWYFVGPYQMKRRKEMIADGKKPVFTDLVKEARRVWAAMDSTAREPYVKLAALDKKRWNDEHEAYLQANPQPPSPPLSAARIYKESDGDTSTKWSKLPVRERRPYIELALQATEVYTRKLTEYREWCTQHGIHFEERVRKRRQIKEVGTSEVEYAGTPAAPAAPSQGGAPKSKRKRDPTTSGATDPCNNHKTKHAKKKSLDTACESLA